MRKDVPIKLKGERVWRPFLGGREIDRLHGEFPGTDDVFPEEWILSAVSAKNVGREDIPEGVCKTDDREHMGFDRYLESYADTALSEAHREKFGTSPGVLIKMIDASVRLPLQVHPDQETAGRLFHSQFGKTECWHIISVREDSPEPPVLYLSFREDADPEQWKQAFYDQDVDKMLSMLNAVPAIPGETILVRGGAPHAIGAGCALIEIQEPTDLTIRLEKVTPSGARLSDQACHQGLGFEKMFECFHFEGYSLEQALQEMRISPKTVYSGENTSITELVGYGQTHCFAMDRMEIRTGLERGHTGEFTGYYVLSGEGTILSGDFSMELAPCDQIYVPAACKQYTLVNRGAEKLVLLCLHGPEIAQEGKEK